MKQLIPSIIFIIALVIVGYASQFFLGPNSAVEEIAEDKLKEKTGLDVNFSGVPEKNASEKSRFEKETKALIEHKSKFPSK